VSFRFCTQRQETVACGMGAQSSSLLLQLLDTCMNPSALVDQAEARDVGPLTGRHGECVGPCDVAGPTARSQMSRGSGGFFFCNGNVFDCLDDEQDAVPQAPASAKKQQDSSSSRGQRRLTKEELIKRREMLLEDLFRLHDLNRNGVLEEMELIKLNEKITMLHFGKDADKTAVRAKYKDLFRTKLDPHGDPVPYEKFRDYMMETLQGLDTDTRAQELIMEQFIAEAQSARVCFKHPSFQSVTDEIFLSQMTDIQSPMARPPPIVA